MKKKIIIFTSSGGWGHISATKAIQSYLSDEYEVKPVYIFQEVFKSIDPAALLTFGKLTGEAIYNYFLRRKWHRVLNTTFDIGSWYFKKRSKTLKDITFNYLQYEKPDLVISVIPIVNNIILNACETLDIPFLLIPTDLDASSFVQDINTPTYKKFHMTLGLNDPYVLNTIQSASISSDYISITGLPMRSDFFETKDIIRIKKEYGIQENKPVITLIMGGQGNSSIFSFAQQLTQLETPAHIIICTGINDWVKHSLQQLLFKPPVSISIIGFTSGISDLFAISDLIITKSGSVSFCEGLYMNVPMILDATHTLLYWERLNHTLLQKHNWGYSLKKISDLNSLVNQILQNKKHYQTIKDNSKQLDKKRLDLAIKPIINELFYNVSL